MLRLLLWLRLLLRQLRLPLLRLLLWRLSLPWQLLRLS